MCWHQYILILLYLAATIVDYLSDKNNLFVKVSKSFDSDPKIEWASGSWPLVNLGLHKIAPNDANFRQQTVIATISLPYTTQLIMMRSDVVIMTSLLIGAAVVSAFVCTFMKLISNINNEW